MQGVDALPDLFVILYGFGKPSCRVINRDETLGERLNSHFTLIQKGFFGRGKFGNDLPDDLLLFLESSHFVVQRKVFYEFGKIDCALNLADFGFPERRPGIETCFSYSGCRSLSTRC